MGEGGRRPDEGPAVLSSIYSGQALGISEKPLINVPGEIGETNTEKAR
jgi:hypothetical protein